MNRAARISLGLATWLASLGGLWLAASGQDEASKAVRKRWWHDIAQYASAPCPVVELELPQPRELAVGDPIFVVAADGELRQIGEVSQLSGDAGPLRGRTGRTGSAQAMFYPNAPVLHADAALTYVSTPDSMTWVIQTLLPPERKAEIALEMSHAIEMHRDEILAALRPIAEKSLREALAVVEQDLPSVVEQHRGELEAIGVRYHRDIVEKEFVPLVKQEIWPIVRRNGEPVANEVGMEIWERVSLWRFGWRFAYDKSPLPEKHLVEKEWRRFVEQEAMPVLSAHTDDFLAAIKQTLKETSHNEKVRAAMRRSLHQVVEDPELQRVIWSIFEQAIVDNPRLRESLKRNWTSPEAQAAFQIASDRLEPGVRRIGDLVLGSPEKGIRPEFARVLRNQILHKDRRWLLLEPGNSNLAGGAAPRFLPVKLGFQQPLRLTRRAKT